MSSSAGRIRSGYDDRSHLTSSDAAYHGRIGATRLEPVHVVLDDGRVRTVSVHTGVNVGSDPHLRDAALAGALHRFEGGEELALPYVFHDPTAKKLALVVPEVLRHRVLEEHAKLLLAIAEDRETPVPAYVREAPAVVGASGLRAFLERPTIDGKALSGERDLLEAQRTALDMERGSLERERATMERERQAMGAERQAIGQDSAGHASALAGLEAERLALMAARAEFDREKALLDQRELRVRERAEAVTSREDEIREELERQEAGTRDLAMREQELEQRLEALVQREQAAARLQKSASEAAGDAPVERPKTIPPPSVKTPFKTLSPPTVPIAQLLPGDGSAADDDVEEIDDIDPVRTSPGRVAGSRRAESDADEEAVEEIVDDDDMAEEVDPDALEPEEPEEPEEIDESLVTGDGLREEITGVSDGDVREVSGPRTAIATLSDIVGVPGSMPASLATREMVAAVDDGVELAVRLPKGAEGLGELDLLVRLSTEEGPTAILELAGKTPGPSGGPITRRLAIDLRNSSERAILDQLRRRFEANVRLFSDDGRPFDDAKVAAPREVNAARVVDRGVRLKTELTSEVAKERALARPPMVNEPHPFGDDAVGESNAAAVQKELGPLADALAPERLDHALTVLSIPRDQIDSAVSRTIERAVVHGLALPTTLTERALASGIVPDAAALAVRQIDAFRGTVMRPDRGGLEPAQIAENWERLLKAAADNEVALDSDTHDLAFRAIRAVKGEEGPNPTDVDPEKFSELAPPQLVMMLEHPRYRRAAAIALADKKDATFAEVLCKAVRKMPRHEVVRVMPKLVGLGEEAGDALIDGLSARKTFVRQGFALVLGHLKLRRAVVPLLHRLIAEESSVHKELARVLGGFGNASFRPFARHLSDNKGGDERAVRTLAFLALAGCEKQVRELTKDGDARSKDLATRALAMLPEARAHEEMVLGKKALDGDDGVLGFSRRFEEELRGEAPETDLPSPPGED